MNDPVDTARIRAWWGERPLPAKALHALARRESATTCDVALAWSLAGDDPHGRTAVADALLTSLTVEDAPPTRRAVRGPADLADAPGRYAAALRAVAAIADTGSADALFVPARHALGNLGAGPAAALVAVLAEIPARTAGGRQARFDLLLAGRRADAAIASVGTLLDDATEHYWIDTGEIRAALTGLGDGLGGWASASPVLEGKLGAWLDEHRRAERSDHILEAVALALADLARTASSTGLGATAHAFANAIETPARRLTTTATVLERAPPNGETQADLDNLAREIEELPPLAAVGPVRALARAEGSNGPTPAGWSVPVRTLRAVERLADAGLVAEDAQGIGATALRAARAAVLATTGEGRSIARWCGRVLGLRSWHYPGILADAIAARAHLAAAPELARITLEIADRNPDPRVLPEIGARFAGAVGVHPNAEQWTRWGRRAAREDGGTPHELWAERAVRPITERPWPGAALGPIEDAAKALAAGDDRYHRDLGAALARALRSVPGDDTRARTVEEILAGEPTPEAALVLAGALALPTASPTGANE